MTVIRTGKMMTVARETGRGVYSMRIPRSFLVVNSLINGGWMMGTRLM